MSTRSLALLLILPLAAYGLIHLPTARSRLRRKFLGRHRDWIARSLGSPLTVAPGTDTWYYPLDTTNYRAMAIQFKRDRAMAVEIIGPGTTSPGHELL